MPVQDNIPNRFIVGAPKCGTTAHHSYLAEHPDVFAGRKELHYFGSDLKNERASRLNNLDDARTKYLSHCTGAGAHSVRVDGSVNYLYSRTAATEIKSMVNDARIIIMLRNPVDFISSWHAQNLFDGSEWINYLGRALNDEPARKAGASKNGSYASPRNFTIEKWQISRRRLNGIWTCSGSKMYSSGCLTIWPMTPKRSTWTSCCFSDSARTICQT